MNFRIGIAFALFFAVAGICNMMTKTDTPQQCTFEVDIITSSGDATDISASGGPGSITGSWWNKEAGGGSNIIGVQAMKMNLGGSYREYVFTIDTCIGDEQIELNGTFTDGSGLCDHYTSHTVVSAYENNAELTIRQKETGDGTCSYVVTR